MRECDNCARCGRDGCTSWDCDFVPRKEAIKAWKEKHETADRKTENSSEKPNNCKKCKWWNESYGCHWKEGVCHYVPKAIIPKQCVSCDSASRIIEAYSRGFKDGADAVKAMPQTFTADGIVFAKMDEPQTDCDGCRNYADKHTADICYECKRSYTDCYEPQAERSE